MRAWIIALLLYASLLAVASTGSATMTGPCTGTLNGVDAAKMIPTQPATGSTVSEEGSVSYTFSAPGEITAWTVSLAYGPLSWPVEDKTDPIEDPEPDTSISSSANVAQYAKHSVGAYVVNAVVTYDGGVCTASGVVTVEGNPLTTTVGGSAAVATAVGAAGVGGATLLGAKAAAAAAGAAA
ncbi:MAG: hypothetical protein R3185_08450 [Candidatus Thermoplasmatota archaeon]|nr:hypothetical protein [Candidatus Thermoplasmatota archaeon]